MGEGLERLSGWDACFASVLPEFDYSATCLQPRHQGAEVGRAQECDGWLASLPKPGRFCEKPCLNTEKDADIMLWPLHEHTSVCPAARLHARNTQ